MAQHILEIYYDLNDLTDVAAIDGDLEKLTGVPPTIKEEGFRIREIHFSFESEYALEEARQKVLDAGYRVFR